MDWSGSQRIGVDRCGRGYRPMLPFEFSSFRPFTRRVRSPSSSLSFAALPPSLLSLLLFICAIFSFPFLSLSHAFHRVLTSFSFPFRL